MNHAYRVVWNGSRGIWQAVSELARAVGGKSGRNGKTAQLKRILLTATLLGLTMSGARATPSSCNAVAGNLAANCGFETAGSWSGNGLQMVNGTFGTWDQHSGSYFDAMGNGVKTLSQTIATVLGGTYSISFFAVNINDPTATIGASFGGAIVSAPATPRPGQTFLIGTSPTSNNSQNYVEYSGSAFASGPSTALVFSTATGTGQFILLDDVVVTLQSLQLESGAPAYSSTLLGGGSIPVDFEGGTLQIAAGAAAIANNFTVGSAAGNTIDANGNATVFSGTFTGAGGLSFTDTSGQGKTMTLTGANTYTGGTTIDGGTLAIGAGGSLAATGALDLASAGAAFDISAGGNQTIGALSGVAGSNVLLGANTLTFGTAANQTFSGSLAGTGGLVKQGSGTWTLDSVNSGFTGTTEVAGGTLEVGDGNTPTALLGGNVNVDSNGTLRGHGTVGGNVANNGVVMPGGTIGTLTLNGNYNQTSSGTLAIEVSPTAGSSLNVSGAAVLNGGLLVVYDPGTYSPRQYRILNATNGVSGRFSTVNSVLLSGADLGSLSQGIAYSTNAVDLVLGSALVAPGDTSIYSALGTSATMQAQSVSAALLERLANRSTQTGTGKGWVTAIGRQDTVGGNGGQPGFQANHYGFMAGFDKRFGENTAGVAGSYDHTDISERNTGDSGTTDTLRVALYGERNVGPVNFAATLGAGLDFLSQKRPFGNATAEGDHMGQEVTTGAQASMPMPLGTVTVTPRAGLRYAYFHANGFGESGAGGQDLNVGADNVHSLQPYVGLTVDKAFGDALRPVNAELRVGYAHELLDANRAIDVAAQDGTIFVAPGTSLPRGYLTAGASVTFHPMKHLDVSLGYDTVINTTHASAQQGSIHVGYRF